MLKVICKMAKPDNASSLSLAHSFTIPFTRLFLASSSLLALPSAGCTFCNSRVKADIAALRTLCVLAVAASPPPSSLRRNTSTVASPRCATVVVRQSAFQGQQRAFTSLMLPGGICNQLKDRHGAAAPPLLHCTIGCVDVASVSRRRQLSIATSSAKFFACPLSTPSK